MIVHRIKEHDQTHFELSEEGCQEPILIVFGILLVILIGVLTNCLINMGAG